MAIRLVIAFDVVIALFPPLHWVMGGDSAGRPLLYFIGSAALITASLFLLAALTKGRGGGVRKAQCDEEVH